jgi:hypothetical protein
VLKKGSAVVDLCNGNWLHHLDWENGVKGRDGKKVNR